MTSSRQWSTQVSLHGFMMAIASSRVGCYPESRVEPDDPISRASGMVPLLAKGEFWDEGSESRIILNLRRRPSRCVESLGGQVLAFPFGLNQVFGVNVASEAEGAVVTASLHAVGLTSPWPLAVDPESFIKKRSDWNQFLIPEAIHEFLNPEIRLQERVSVAFLLREEFGIRQRKSLKVLQRFRNGDYEADDDSIALVSATFLSQPQMATWSSSELLSTMAGQGAQAAEMCAYVAGEIEREREYVNSGSLRTPAVMDPALMALLIASRLQGWGPKALLNWIRSNPDVPAVTRMLLGLLVSRTSVQAEFVHSRFYERVVAAELHYLRTQLSAQFKSGSRPNEPQLLATDSVAGTHNQLSLPLTLDE